MMSLTGPAQDGIGGTPAVTLTGIQKKYGRVTAVQPTELVIQEGEFLAILGPSGCGKSTLLKMIGGFANPTAGTIRIDGRDVTRIPPERRPTNLVFQGYGLFPHMTVRQNVGYGLKFGNAGHEDPARAVADAMALVHIETLADRMVTELSGGQAQRVALARALIKRPRVLLLDEPFSALDLQLRKEMRLELRQLHRTTGGSFVFVTHDQEEALSLATRVCVMQAGRIVQDGRPSDIYSRPATRFVATFIGDANLLGGTRAGNIVRLDAGPAFASEGPDGPVTCVVRPEAISLAETLSDTAPENFSVVGVLRDRFFLGALTRLELETRDGTTVSLGVPNDLADRAYASVGMEVSVTWSSSDQQLLDE